jgi:CheY-like chemotaxis protein
MKTILIVEDNALNRQLLEAILDANHYDRLSVDNGSSAVELAISKLPDLILMDIHMVGIDGYTALTMIRANDAAAKIPVIAITGNATLDDRRRMITAGFDDIIKKPYTIDTVLDMISSILGTP